MRATKKEGTGGREEGSVENESGSREHGTETKGERKRNERDKAKRGRQKHVLGGKRTKTTSEGNENAVMEKNQKG